MTFIPSPEFGPFIKHFLESKHRSKSYVEKKTGIGRKTLNRWERGDVQRIQDGTLEEFAKCFNLTVEDFIKEFEAHQKSIASDTAQTTAYPPSNGETVASMPRNPTEATGPFRNKWKLIGKVVSGLVIASLLVFAIYAILINPRIPSNTVKPVLISGKALCAKSEPVVNIWVDVFKGSNLDKGISGYADLRTPNSNGSEVAFVYVLKGDAYNLHVGCGGSKQHWKGVYITEIGSGPVHDHKFHYFICHDVPPAIDYGSCELQY